MVHAVSRNTVVTLEHPRRCSGLRSDNGIETRYRKLGRAGPAPPISFQKALTAAMNGAYHDCFGQVAHEMDAGELNLQITSAFPKSLRDDVLRAVSVLPAPFLPPAGSFSVVIGGEFLVIPSRVYYHTEGINADRLTGAQKVILSCLLTRHHDGFIREEHLGQIVSCGEVWIPPFVVQLIGEYVIEILRAIHGSRALLSSDIYAGFLKGNAAFWARTKQRVVSYWDCYYRRTWPHPEDYVGFQLIDHLNSLLAENTLP
jgi:hypothetical protein